MKTTQQLKAVLYTLTVVLALSLTTPSSATASNLDPLINPGFETVGETPKSAYDWQAYGRGYVRATGVKRSGQASLKLVNYSRAQSSGAYQRIDFQQAVEKPVLITGYVKGEFINKAPNSYFGATLYAEIHTTTGEVIYWNTPANSGTFNWRLIGFNTGNLPHLNAPIDYILLVPALINASGTAFFDDLTVWEYEPDQNMVTIMLDDGEDNAYTAAYPILQEQGLSASLTVISGSINQTGYITSQQLDEMTTSGFEVVSHGVSHEDMTQMTRIQAERELTKSKNALSRWNPKHFAFPYGAYNSDLLALADKYYDSARAYEIGNNSRGVFPFDIKVRSVVSTTTLEEVQGWLDQAKTQKEWVVLVFHTIGQGDDNYHTNEQNFKEIINQITLSGVNVKTYGQAFNEFKGDSM